MLLCGKYGHSRKMCLNLYYIGFLNIKRIWKKLKSNWMQSLNFVRMKFIPSYKPFTQAGLVQFGWKKKLKVEPFC